MKLLPNLLCLVLLFIVSGFSFANKTPVSAPVLQFTAGVDASFFLGAKYLRIKVYSTNQQMQCYFQDKQPATQGRTYKLDLSNIGAYQQVSAVCTQKNMDDLLQNKYGPYSYDYSVYIPDFIGRSSMNLICTDMTKQEKVTLTGYSGTDWNSRIAHCQ